MIMRAAFEAGAHALHQHVAFGEARLQREGLGVDADRESPHLEFTPARFAPIGVDDAAGAGRGQASAEIVHVRLRLKADDVIGAERAQQAAIARHRRRRLGDGQGIWWK